MSGTVRQAVVTAVVSPVATTITLLTPINIAGIGGALPAHQILSALCVLPYLVLSANLEVGAVALCFLKRGKLRLKPTMSSSMSRGE